MKAAVYERYGPPEVIHIEDVEPPMPAADELLVRVHATTVNRTDCHRRGASPFIWRFIDGLRRPKHRVFGMEFAGVVEQVGTSVTDFAVGDEVFGMKWFGAHAELVTIPAARLVVHKPANVSFEQAAAASDAALDALGCLRNAGAGPGMHVLVFGSSGAIGSAAVQLAKQMGARVTAVCQTKNIELARSLGADEVLDYTAGQDFTANRDAYDVVMDAVGRHSYLRSRRAIKPGGRYASTDGLLNLPLLLVTRFMSKRVVWPIARATKADMELLARLLESGEFRPVVGRTYPLEQIVEASRYVETRQKVGNVVLTVSSRR
jgi:NADPH:quinone reductase-like Zn-dependent oxidoreductase